jgi:uncharacterized SAM-binding protein YcdF (DUF218 family)
MEFPVKLLLTPVMIIWALLLLTLIQRWRTNRRLPRLATLAFLLYWLFCTKPLVDQLAKPLELAYPAFTAITTTGAMQPLSHILVLGCNHQDSSFLPLTSKADPCSLARLSEAIRLWHLYPDAVLHVSGHIPDRVQSHTEFARQYAIAMGVAPAKIVSHPEAFNTRTEVQSMIKAIAQQQTAVITSALHMPRTCNWFAHYGGKVIAAPTDFYVRRDTADIGWQGWMPTVQGIHALSYVVYEYMGLTLQYGQRLADPSSAPQTEAVGCHAANLLIHA